MITARAGSNRRLMALFAVFSVLPLVFLVVLPLRSSTDALSRAATQRVESVATVHANVVNEQVSALTQLVGSFAEPSMLDVGSVPVADGRHPARAVLEELRRSNADIRSTALLDPKGMVLANSPWSPEFIGSDRSGRDYFTGSIATAGVHVSPVFESAAGDHARLVAVSRAVRVDGRPDGDVRGVLVASVDVRKVFQASVDALTAQSGMNVTIYDDAAQVVAAPGGGPGAAADGRVRDAMAGHRWVGQVQGPSCRCITAYVPIEPLHWVIVASVASDEALALVHQQRSSVLVIAGILGIVMLVGLSSLATSLRARDRAEGRVRSSEARTRAILETAAQAYMELDDGCRIVEWNRKATEVFGWTREEACGKRAPELWMADGPSEQRIRDMAAAMHEPDADRGPLRVELEGRAKRGGEPMRLEATAWVADVDGERRASMFVQDVTAQRRMDAERELIVQRQREVVEELREADRVKTDFISTVSHELRTPLTSIVGYVEMMNDGYGGDLAAPHRSMVEVIERNSRRLLGLIEDVLTLSRIEAGAFKVESMVVDVQSLVVGVGQALLPTSMAQEVSLDLEVAGATGSVRGDPSQLERVLLNLVSNAIKFTPAGGRVVLAASRDEEGVHLAVTDTGIGIPLEEQHRLFSRFFRSSIAQEQAIQGTGLGLAIVKTIVDRHGGRISVRSEPGHGTRVTVDLPALPSDPPGGLDDERFEGMPLPKG